MGGLSDVSRRHPDVAIGLARREDEGELLILVEAHEDLATGDDRKVVHGSILRIIGARPAHAHGVIDVHKVRGGRPLALKRDRGIRRGERGRVVDISDVRNHGGKLQGEGVIFEMARNPWSVKKTRLPLTALDKEILGSGI